MNLDQLAIPLQPRRATGCFDAAVKLFAANLGRMLSLWTYVALPSCLLLYVMSVRSRMDVRLTLITLYGATWILGVLTVSAAVRAAFGEPFPPPRRRAGPGAWTRPLSLGIDVAALFLAAVIGGNIAADILGADWIHGPVEVVWYVLLLILLLLRLALFCAREALLQPHLLSALVSNGIRRAVIAVGPLFLLFPAGTGPVLVGLLLCVISIAVLIRLSFLSESAFLAELDDSNRGRRVRDLVRREGGNLFLRGWLLSLLAVLLTTVVFFTVDQACQLLLGYPILIGRLDQVLPADELSGTSFNAVFATAADVLRFLLRDARCLTVFAAAALFVYPIARIAWFFCYIDLRVRRDCWDMELKFQQEARRLEASA